MNQPSLEDWHRRFAVQAGWTRDVQAGIFHSYGVKSSDRILEVGCGTGALISSLAAGFPADYTGIDLDRSSLGFALSRRSRAAFAAADGARLPFRSGFFKAAVCHYLLMWVDDPLSVLREMARVVTPGGFVAALAEPDYGSRIDHPAPLDDLGRLQRQALANQGADSDLGRRLPGLFSDAGLSNISAGILGAKWQTPWDETDFSEEWSVLESDLTGIVTAEKMAAYKTADETARRSGSRVLFVPTFYAAGEVQSNG